MSILRKFPWIQKHPRVSAGIVAAVVLVVILALLPGGGPMQAEALDQVYFKTQRGPLTISLDEGGTIVSREQHTVATDLSEDTTFVWLIPEGSEVEKGDLLAELASTYFTDRKEELEMQMIANESELARAENELKVALNENEAQVSKAEVDYRLAEMELEKYKEGEYPQRLMELETSISIAREELQRAEDKLDGSRKLHEKGYITGSELQADTLAATRAQINLQLSESGKRIFEMYTYQTELETRATDAEQKRLTLERVRHQATSREQFAKTNLANQKIQLQRRQARLAQVVKDIANCQLVAPAAGMVIYATTVRDGWNYREPYAVGREVDERQDIFYIPSSGLRNAELTVHESNLEMVKTGMPARVRVEAIHNSEFTGTVSDIAVMPNQETEWTNPNLKVFDVAVELNSNDERLRTGMSCLVEVIVHRYQDVHYVPVQAVAQRQGQPFVYVRNGNELEERMVEVGLSDNRMTAILSGLQEGEEVLLSPPFTTEEEEEENEEESGESPDTAADPMDDDARPPARDDRADDAYSDET